jgi:hypothetical protein
LRIHYRQLLPIVALALSTTCCQAAELSSDAKATIPKDVQQLIVVDYRVMQNSTAAMELKERILPPELERLAVALKNAKLNVDKDADVLAFAAFRGPNANASRIVGIAQGQFQTQVILAGFAKSKTKPIVYRNNNIYPMGAAGMSVVFLNQTTMVFGDRSAVKVALDARDGIVPNFLSDVDMVNDMGAVDKRAIWSLLDAKGTQTMMKSVLGDAAQLADYDTVRNRMKSSRYTMDFDNGVKFDLAVVMSDTMTAATCATLMTVLVMLDNTSSTSLEKTVLDRATIDSNAGTLTVDYSSSDSEFASLLTTPLFQSVVK